MQVTLCRLSPWFTFGNTSHPPFGRARASVDTSRNPEYRAERSRFVRYRTAVPFVAAFRQRRPGSDPAAPVGLKLQAKVAEAVGIERQPYLAHQVQVVVQVVDAGQHGAEHLAAEFQVVQVGT